MIRILGVKRIITLAILVAANLLLGAGIYLYLIPHQAKKKQEFQILQSQIATVQGDVSRMQIEFEEIEKQKAEFQVLVKDGFFRNQSRREAEEMFKRIQLSSNVVSAVASIAAGKIEENEEAAKAEYKILASPITLTIEAMDDVDIYRYLYMLEQNFPGYLMFETMNMERTSNVDATILRAVASNQAVPLVKANLEMTWRTMIPNAAVKMNPDGTPTSQ